MVEYDSSFRNNIILIVFPSLPQHEDGRYSEEPCGWLPQDRCSRSKALAPGILNNDSKVAKQTERERERERWAGEQVNKQAYLRFSEVEGRVRDTER